ncbi:C4-dicarboxylate ABC transporter permease [Bordetella genomosp. 1]|uniref:TRAP transporter small permease protein n=1 Tax=Bordetella genomosp. 1 TaxID=1395607 RepID=A0A261RUM2_9BORD|nr:TRAP transporter small permease [Bordetella genomosp. 1]MDQ8030941.1 TRAP transporter small permease [Bordetella sp.]OZI28769.1 C4-dicarboxylate ABC transporter permease [Bordetella genomosp. 1]OZI55828.1 C4-dicarboxylate ABC transporter permease [Bordetella genomosp. 1]
MSAQTAGRAATEADGEGQAALAAPLSAYTRGCAWLARVCLKLSLAGLILLLLAVSLQIFGRHVLNNTPTWAESLSLLLVLFVTMLGAAVGVRDAGHIGFESLVELLPAGGQRNLKFAIHALVLVFGLLMAWNCAVLAESVSDYAIPNLGISEAWKYVPATISGVLISLFSIEHIVALARHQKVEKAWH